VDLLFAIAGTLLLIGVLAGTLLVFPAMWRGFREQWQRHPRNRRRRGLIAGAVVAIAIVIEATLLITSPWGSDSVAYVLGIGNGTLFVLVMAAVAVQAVHETRRAQRRRAGQDR
jgi:hypothetical protein